jgi:hypothetical protein
MRTGGSPRLERENAYARTVPADERFAQIVAALENEPGIGKKRMFGADGLSTGGKFFAMLYKGRLVVKLPRGRVDELVTAGEGGPFDPGHGRVMKEWVAIAEESRSDWLALTQEARTFVAGK